MEFKEFKNFRDYDRKFVKVTNFSKENIKKLKIENLTEPIYGILYIDKECGVTLRILGDEKNNIKDEGIMLRSSAFENLNFETFEGNDFLKDVLKNQINEYYYDDNLNKLLEDTNLDKFRHDEFPNDVRAILPNEDQPEQMWVRLVMKTNEENLYVAELLDDSYVNKSYSAGSTVAIILYKEDDFEGLIINGFVKITE